jgi:hypothetical protein
MKEMIYKPKREIEVLDRGVYKEHEYFVISLGTHPCAYVKLNGENPQIAENVSCHGGVTYNRDYLMLSNDEKLIGNFIGWDYAHLNDRWGDTFCGYEYTTGEMVIECREVIDELVDG